MMQRIRSILAVPEAEQEFTPTFGVPVDLAFGDTASEGVATTLARSDHRHGMPAAPSAIILSLIQGGFFYHELACTNAVSGSPSNGIMTRQGLTVNLGEDNPDGSGGFGQIRMNTGIASPGQGSTLVVMANVPTASFSTNTGTQFLPRMKEFQCSAHPQKVSGSLIPKNVDMGVGGFVFNIPDGSNFHVVNIVDGLGFVGQFDVNGDGNWKAQLYSSSTLIASLDTGVPLDITLPAGIVNNQKFRIVESLGDYGFFINGVLVAVMLQPAIPTVNVCGWGALMEHTAPRTDSQSLFVDKILLRCRRT